MGIYRNSEIGGQEAFEFIDTILYPPTSFWFDTKIQVDAKAGTESLFYPAGWEVSRAFVDEKMSYGQCHDRAEFND